MHIFIAGICGTFMAGIALLAREKGFTVTGCDAQVYPPMSDQLRENGIEVLQSYDPGHLTPRPDVVVIGNALSRGNPLVEHVLEEGIPYVSGPQWLYENVLIERRVVAISGTHGKTTTSSMLAWILECCGELPPGFLIGGVPGNFGVSSRLGVSPYFVIEADEYDTAFFDKRSKFVHYRPRILIINNIEYDHADIFPDIGSIQRQFHHLVRVIPASGVIVYPAGDPVVEETLNMGCWSRRSSFSTGSGAAEWHADLLRADGSEFRLSCAASGKTAVVQWGHLGVHNVCNALAATAAAAECGVEVEQAAAALSRFGGVKRRLEKIGEIGGVRVYDDFAHHPTAIETTLAGLRANNPAGRIVAVIEPRSNTMRLGVHENRLLTAVRQADRVLWYQPAQMGWDMREAVAEDGARMRIYSSTDAIIESLIDESREGDCIVIMSNGGFDGIHQRLLRALDSSVGSADIITS